MVSASYAGRDFVHQSLYGSAPIAPHVRESRRSSDVGLSQRSSTSSQPRRSLSVAAGENSAPRWRNPRLSSGLPPPKLPCGMSSAAARIGTALTDITNTGAGRSSKDTKVRTHSGYDTDKGRNTFRNKEPSGERLAPAEAMPPLTTIPTVQGVSEYATEIYEHLFRKEKQLQPRAEYMESQADITGRMREILIDWLIEVHMKYRLRPETLFLTVNLLDRYLSLASVPRRILQLVGVVAMFVASKFEEISPPEAHDFVYVTDNAYTKEDLFSMECTMLTALNFQVVVPTTLNFMDRLQRVNCCDGAHRELVQYIVEIALLDVRMIRYLPSHLAAAALLLSNLLLGRRPAWPAVMAQHSRYVESSLQLCVEELRVLLEAVPTNSLQAVRKKYALSEHQFVARMTFTPS
mmetsp:Transcript_5542/g.8642  ORF Transcript_5542/g.8642 Transcript_5542/m.8642 type:complete len:406 (-) Transcript_5542:138-1355(-)